MPGKEREGGEVPATSLHPVHALCDFLQRYPTAPPRFSELGPRGVAARRWDCGVARLSAQARRGAARRRAAPIRPHVRSLEAGCAPRGLMPAAAPGRKRGRTRGRRTCIPPSKPGHCLLPPPHDTVCASPGLGGAQGEEQEEGTGVEALPKE
ncbi:hypothetical protein J1605_010057 [Eschrichtius robustus]|uniref:Uncharacterized protein n=1 Tax=Eschrichtius robustus TaxID=9764 RepID=A0AB34GTA0_ESCRO|nr:hypothetical protein J1605_010057 [Eschrichtius robustus]